LFGSGIDFATWTGGTFNNCGWVWCCVWGINAATSGDLVRADESAIEAGLVAGAVFASIRTLVSTGVFESALPLGSNAALASWPLAILFVDAIAAGDSDLACGD